jgi:hypothetical protein
MSQQPTAPDCPDVATSISETTSTDSTSTGLSASPSTGLSASPSCAPSSALCIPMDLTSATQVIVKSDCPLSASLSRSQSQSPPVSQSLSASQSLCPSQSQSVPLSDSQVSYLGLQKASSDSCIESCPQEYR